MITHLTPPRPPRTGARPLQRWLKQEAVEDGVESGLSTAEAAVNAEFSCVYDDGDITLTSCSDSILGADKVDEIFASWSDFQNSGA